jgi:hypothetical protein
LIKAEQAIVIARDYIQRNYPDCVEDAPKVYRLRADLRPDDRRDADAWEVCFPWKPVKGLYRTSCGCCVLIDMASGELLLN